MYELQLTISHQEFYENYDSTYFGQRRCSNHLVFIVHFHIGRFIEKYNKDNNEADTREEIDDDKLCEVILTTKGMKLCVSSTNTVLGIAFA